MASVHWRHRATTQLNLILFAEFVVCFIVDVWPYATYYLQPVHSGMDQTTRARMALLTFSAVIIPLVTPRPFRTLTLNAKPSEEDTASLLSFYTFSFLDKIVFRANRVGNVTLQDMPEVPVRDRIEALSERTCKALDPVQSGRRDVMYGAFLVWSESGFRFVAVRILTSTLLGVQGRTSPS